MTDLRAENEELRERVRQLEKLLRDPLPELWNFPLSAMKRRLLGLLYRTPGTVPRDRLRFSLGGSDIDISDNCMHVHMVVLRQKCRTRGITIETAWRSGYRLTPESRAVVRALIDKQAAATAAILSHKGGRHGMDA